MDCKKPNMASFFLLFLTPDASFWLYLPKQGIELHAHTIIKKKKIHSSLNISHRFIPSESNVFSFNKSLHFHFSLCLPIPLYLHLPTLTSPVTVCVCVCVRARARVCVYTDLWTEWLYLPVAVPAAFCVWLCVCIGIFGLTVFASGSAFAWVCITYLWTDCIRQWRSAFTCVY